MKKILLALAAIAAVVVLGGFVYVLVFMEEPPDTALVGGSDASLPDAQLNVPREVETQADVLDALDYETTQNQDTVAWLHIPGTRVNNSVLQGHDNIAYLRTNERKEASVYGCYFADAECNVGPRELLSHNTVVYGHSDLQDNPDGPRFSQLFKFTDPEFAKTTPVIEFSTLENFMDWQVFAVFYTDTGFDYIAAEPEGGVDRLAAEAKQKSLYDYGVAVGPEDRILTLSTCSIRDGSDGTHRLVVMAKLLPEDAPLPETANLTVQTPQT